MTSHPDSAFPQDLFDSFQMSIEEHLRASPMLTMLQILLPEAVRLRVLAIQQHGGGPTPADFRHLETLSKELFDTPIFATKKDHKAAHQFNALAEALAVLSFAPGGVTLFGIHFQTQAIQEDRV